MKLPNGKSFVLSGIFIVFFVIALFPVLYMYLDALFSNDGFSLSNYSNAIINSRQLGLLSRSLVLSIATTFCSILIGVSMAFIISRTSVPLKPFLKIMSVLPLFIPSYVNAISWIHLMGKNGKINLLLMGLFKTEEPFFTIYGMPGAIFVLTLSYYPFVTLLTINALDNMDSRLEDAGKLATGIPGIIRRIMLPLSAPAIISGAIFTFTFAIADFGVPALLEVNTFPVEIFSQFSAFFDPRSASAISLPLVVITIFAIMVQRHYLQKKSYITISGQAKSIRLINLGKFTYPSFIFCCIIIILSIVLPVITLIIESTSLETYKVAFKTGYKQIINSIYLGAMGATIIIIFGFFLSYILERVRLRAKTWIDIALVIPFAVPATIVGIGLIRLWNKPGLSNLVYGTFIIIILGYIARFMSFGIRTISAGYSQISTSVEESAVMANVSWQNMLWKIVVPLLKPALYTGWLLVFILCIGELGTTILIYPSGYDTLPIRIFTLMHYGPDNLVAAMCVILLAIAMLPLALFSILTRRTVKIL